MKKRNFLGLILSIGLLIGSIIIFNSCDSDSNSRENKCPKSDTTAACNRYATCYDGNDCNFRYNSCVCN